MVWKTFITTIDKGLATQITDFRSDLDKLLKRACRLKSGRCYIECLSSGSNSLTSDIDITVKGDCLVENYIQLNILHDILRKVFEQSELFKLNDEIDVSKIFIFFDINFYLSNFGIKQNNKTDEAELASYIVTTESETQMSYAINGIPKTKQYALLVYDLAILKNDIDNSLTQEKANRFVDLMSQIAAQEDECYITQGAFFHVVMHLQRGIPFRDRVSGYYFNIWNSMMICSAVENIKFAFSHPSSRGKYIIRVFDALEQIQTQHANHLFDQEPGYNNGYNTRNVSYIPGYNTMYNNPLYNANISSGYIYDEQNDVYNDEPRNSYNHQNNGDYNKHDSFIEFKRAFNCWSEM